jgi:hypothetical protein
MAQRSGRGLDIPPEEVPEVEPICVPMRKGSALLMTNRTLSPQITRAPARSSAINSARSQFADPAAFRQMRMEHKAEPPTQRWSWRCVVRARDRGNTVQADCSQLNRAP